MKQTSCNSISWWLTRGWITFSGSKRAYRDLMPDHWVRKIPWEERAIHSGILARKIPWTSLVGYSPQDHKGVDTNGWLSLASSLTNLRLSLFYFKIVWAAHLPSVPGPHQDVRLSVLNGWQPQPMHRHWMAVPLWCSSGKGGRRYT